ncbi:MAG: methyl-accepting chemotaxis protein [Thermodesulfobacteriota bacterium]
MARILVRSLMAKVSLFCLAMVMVPTAIVGYLSFRDARAALEKTQLEKLEATRDLARQYIVEYFQNTVKDLAFLSQAKIIKDSIEVLAFYASMEGKNAQSESMRLEVGSEKYNMLIAEMDPVLRDWMLPLQSSHGFRDILVVSGQGRGQIGYTLTRGQDLGAELKAGALSQTPLAKLFDKVAATGKPALADFSHYSPAGEPSAFVGVPVVKDNKEFLGMLALRIGSGRIDQIMKAAAEVGVTGDAFLVGEDLVMRSNSRQDSNSMLKTTVDTHASREALKGHKGIGEVIDGRGESVLNAWSGVGLKGASDLGAAFEWGLVAQIDAREAYAPAMALGKRLLVVVPVVGLVITLIALILARAATRPITTMAAIASDVSGGDLTVEVPPIKRSDEIGALAEAFKNMLASLREQTRLVLEGVNVLSSSAAEISAAISQQTQTSSKTVAAVAETTATAEQVKQTAGLTNEKAKKVADMSRHATQISSEGSKATEETAHKITLIRAQMESIAETVVRLSEQSRAIEDIITTVQDLADQSNLLAVNASIEAARAGEYGKGFAVVAHEIKALADQSREATAQIRSILEVNAKWVSASVMATEQGSKAVQAGLEQSSIAGDSIRRLLDSVNAVAEAASVIQVASEQQSVGATQVSAAMTSIEQAMHQQASGTTEIEQAAIGLEQLGMQLKELVARYRV